jgi:hypothetical protein
MSSCFYDYLRPLAKYDYVALTEEQWGLSKLALLRTPKVLVSNSHMQAYMHAYSPQMPLCHDKYYQHFFNSIQLFILLRVQELLGKALSHFI